jgi:hypothetical protein
MCCGQPVAQLDYVTFMHKVLTITVIMDEKKNSTPPLAPFFLSVIKVSSYHDNQLNHDQPGTDGLENIVPLFPITLSITRHSFFWRIILRLKGYSCETLTSNRLHFRRQCLKFTNLKNH